MSLGEIMTTTPKQMTLEQVRDWLRNPPSTLKNTYRGYSKRSLADEALVCADAIDAELAKQRNAEPVAHLQIGCYGGIHIHASDAAKRLGEGNYNLYTHPHQRNAAEVTDEMVIAARKAYTGLNDVELRPGPSDSMRRALEAALSAVASRDREDAAYLSAIREITTLKDTVIKILTAVREYLPPDGISKDECLSRVIGAVDNAEINKVMGYDNA